MKRSACSLTIPSTFLLLWMCALQATEQSDPALPYIEDMEEEEDDGAIKGGWTSAGLPRDQNKEASDRRTKHQGG